MMIYKPMIHKPRWNLVRLPIVLKYVSVGLLLSAYAGIYSPASANEVQGLIAQEDTSGNWWDDSPGLSLEGVAFPYTPPNRGAPGQTRDAGSRPVCPDPSHPFTAIAPTPNWGETTQAYPTFWLYLPYAVGDVEFFLRDEQTQTEIYRTVFPMDAGDVPDGGGIQAFQMPSDAPSLELDTAYNWQFDLICNTETGSNYRVTGVIIRRSPSDDLQAQLATANPLETAFIYAEAGLWYDSLTVLAQLRQMPESTPEVEQAWIDLLEHPFIDLGDLVTRPLVDSEGEF